MSKEEVPHSDSDVSSEDGWIDAEGEEEGEEQLAIISLLDDRVFSDAASMLSYCKDKFGLDFLAVRQRLALDFYGTIKLINFIRQRVHEGIALPEQISAQDIEHDRYLKPVLDDDALILCLDELPEPSADAAPSPSGVANPTAVKVAGQVSDELLKENVQLREELDRLARQFQSYREAVQQTLDQRWGEDEVSDSAGSNAKGESKTKRDDSEYYFESYAHNEIHETMLKDTVRTDAYRDFIYNNKGLFAGKTVLDIGCGTGILSMFCAKAGAKQVIAVDRSEIIDKARENIFRNGLADKITCLKGKIEEVTLPVAQVDIIVSEWMGYCLLYEAMLPSVLWARDRYLKPDGLLVPSHATLWIAPISDSEYVSDHVTFWRDVYGFDMEGMMEGIYKDARIDVLPSKSVCGRPSMFRYLNLHTVAAKDLVFTSDFSSALSADADSLDGFLIWFDMFFALSREAEIVPEDATAQDWAGKGTDLVAFTTGPYGPETHWKQGLLLNQTKPAPSLKSGEGVTGQITFSVADDNARALSLRVVWTEGASGEQHTQTWSLK